MAEPPAKVSHAGMLLPSTACAFGRPGGQVLFSQLPIFFAVPPDSLFLNGNSMDRG